MNEREFNEIFAERLRYYLNKYDITQAELAKRLGVGTTSVYNWLNGIKTPRMDKVNAMCEIFNCRRVDLTSETPPPEGCVRIPVLGRVAAGVPIEACDEIIGYEEIPESLNRTGEFFALRIKGDSMSPNICDKDIVIVRQQPDAESNEIVIAAVNGNEAVCKRLRKYEGGLELISSNPSYEPMQFSANEINDTPVTILGKVIELRRRID